MPRWSPSSQPDPGGMDKRVQLQRRSITQNSGGEQVETWTTIRTLWARVEPVAGNEINSSESRFADARLKLHIRYQPDIYITRGEHRFSVNQVQWQQMGYAWDDALGTWEDRHLDILDVVNPNFQSRTLIIICREWAV